MKKERKERKKKEKKKKSRKNKKQQQKKTKKERREREIEKERKKRRKQKQKQKMKIQSVINKLRTPNSAIIGYATEGALFDCHFRAAVHRRGQCPLKGLGTNKTVEAS